MRKDRLLLCAGFVFVLSGVIRPAGLFADKPDRNKTDRNKTDRTHDVEPKTRGKVIGLVIDRDTHRPLEGVTVVVEENAEFAESGATVGTTNNKGEFQVETMLGRRSSKFDLEQALITFPFGLIIPGGMNRVTKIINVTQLNVRVTHEGYKTFVGPVSVLTANANRFSVRLDDILLAPESSEGISLAPEGQAELIARRFEAKPSVSSPRHTIDVEAEVVLPRGMNRADLWCAPIDKADHWSITVLRPVKKMNPQTRVQVYKGEIDPPRRLEEPSQVIYLWTATRRALYGSRVDGARPLLIQIAREPDERETAEIIARAFDLEQKGQLAAANESYEQAAKQSPPSRFWLSRQRGMLLLRLNRPDEAVTLFADLTEKEKKLQEVFYPNYATALLEVGQPKKALDLLLPFTKDKKKRRSLPPEYHLAIARCYLATGEIGLADDYYAKASKDALWSTEFVQEFNLERVRAVMKSKPDDPDAHLAYAHALADMKRHEEALEEYRKILQRDERQPWVYLDVAHTLTQLHREPAAIIALQRALELEPENIELHDSITDLYIRTGDYEKALEHAKQCADSPGRKRDFFTCHRYGLLLLWKGNRKEAVEQLSNAIYLSRGKGEVRADGIFAGYGVIPFGPKKSLMTGFNRPEAEHDFVILEELRDLEKNPEGGLSHLNIGVALAELGFAPMAMQYLEIAVRKNVESPRLHYAMGLAHDQLGHADEARRELERAVELEPSYENAAVRLAQLYAAQGETDRAQAVLIRYERAREAQRPTAQLRAGE